MSDIIYGPGNPGVVIDVGTPDFDNWPASINGEIHIEGNPIIGITTKPNLTASEHLERSREHLIQAYKDEALGRIQGTMAAIDSIGMIELLAALWPTIDQALAGADLILVKDIYQFAKGRISIIKTADQAAIDAADPATDAWPTAI